MSTTGPIELSWCKALSATRHGLGMTLSIGMTLIYPVQPQPSGDTANIGSHLAPTRRSATIRDFSAIREKLTCMYSGRGLRKFRETPTKKTAIREFSSKREKRRPVNDDPIQYSSKYSSSVFKS